MAIEVLTLADLKTALGNPSGVDSLLNLIIEQVEARFRGDIGQDKLLRTTYTAERYRGTGTRRLRLRRRPLRAVTAASIDTEATIDTASTDVLNFETGNDSTGDLWLVSRSWTRPTDRPLNVSVTYDAGYDSASIKADIQDAWAAILEACSQLYDAVRTDRRGITSQSFMSGSIGYMTDQLLDPESGFYRRRWLPVVSRHKRESFIEAVGWQSPAALISEL